MTSISSPKELYLSNIRIGNDTYAIYAVARGADGAQLPIPEAFSKETVDKIRNLGKALISAHEKNTPTLKDIQSINQEGFKTSTATLPHTFSISPLNPNPFNDELLNDIIEGNPSLNRTALTAQDAWNRLSTLFIQEFLKQGSKAKATPVIESHSKEIPLPKKAAQQPKETTTMLPPDPEDPSIPPVASIHPPRASWLDHHPAAVITSEDSQPLYDSLSPQIRRDLIRHIYCTGVTGTLEDRISELFKRKASLENPPREPNALYCEERGKLTQEIGAATTPGEALLESYYKGDSVRPESSGQFLADLTELPRGIQDVAESNRLYEYIGQQAGIEETRRIEWAKSNYTNPNHRSFVIQSIERYLHSQ